MNARRLLVAALLVAGAALLLRGAWIPAKAVVGQRLLAHAWQRTLTEGSDVRPWPWADTHPVARLRVPRLGVSQVVLDGAGGATLAWAPGRMIGTAAPGEAGTSVLSGHRDTHFAFLADLRAGDVVELETPAGTHRYRIRSLEVADVRDGGLRVARRGAPELLLVTCYPFDAVGPSGPLRYVAAAERLAATPEPAAAALATRAAKRE